MSGEIGAPSIPLPSFPDRAVSIFDHGAVPGGLVDNTAAIASAISACSRAGGGRVVIPRGIWLTGPIDLQSNIDLHVEEGALVLFSTNHSDYPLVETNFEGLDRIRCTSPISGRDLENIAITGRGIFDGSGHVWRPVKRSKTTAAQWHALVSSGGVVTDEGSIWWPAGGTPQGEALMRQLRHDGKSASPEEYAKVVGSLRPVLLSLVNCRRVLLDGPTFQNSPAWALHPLLCEDVTVRNIFVKNEWYAQNGDGLDLDSCRSVRVTGSVFDVGDDAICVKSGRDEAGRKRGRPCTDIWIDNCTVYRGHGGFTVGSEMSGGVCNVHVSDCTFVDTDLGLRFKSTRGRGGVVENIHVERVNMIRIAGEAISFNLWYGRSRKDPEVSRPVPVSEETPIFRDIVIRDVVCRGASRAIAVHGLPEMPVQRIRLEHVSISSRRGAEFTCADTVEMKKCEIIAEDGPAVTVRDSSNIITG
jgi:polygalacturonase